MSREVGVLGVDIGGTGCKAAIVDITHGKLKSERFRLETPQPSTPENVGKTIQKIVEHFNWKGMVGFGFPAIVKNGVSHSAANIHGDWLNFNAEKYFGDLLSLPVKLTNDADAAGIAALRFGAAQNQKGTVLFLTIGTGIGSALFRDGKLIPNTEFGHLFFKEKIAEKTLSNAIRKRDKISMKKWGKMWTPYLQHLERLVNPDLIILGGGGGKKFDRFAPYLKIDTKIVAAELSNNAGIVGAAIYAYDTFAKDTAKPPSKTLQKI